MLFLLLPVIDVWKQKPKHVFLDSVLISIISRRKAAKRRKISDKWSRGKRVHQDYFPNFSQFVSNFEKFADSFADKNLYRIESKETHREINFFRFAPSRTDCLGLICFCAVAPSETLFSA